MRKYLTILSCKLFSRKKLHPRCLKIGFWLRVLNVDLNFVRNLQIKPKKYSTRKYMWHSFWKDKRSWKDCKQSECLCRSSCPKGSLNKVFWEILQNSQENICTGIHFWRFHEICKNTFFAEQHQTTASDYSSINSSEGSTSSNVNEVIRATLNFFIFFFRKDFTCAKSTKRI